MSQYEFSVSVQTRYLPDQSDPDSHQFAFAYTLTIRNTGQIAAQLISRHWIITDSDAHVQEVKGLGVVGHQPLIPPGEQFEYTSWAVIATPVGTMRGEYFCVAEDGERFEAPIAEFALHMAYAAHASLKWTSGVLPRRSLASSGSRGSDAFSFPTMSTRR
ncbi:ApaG protein [Candidatus Burkholderia humilis]|nr:ApaG protein [Candidatus Burkholderia humilis]